MVSVEKYSGTWTIPRATREPRCFDVDDEHDSMRDESHCSSFTIAVTRKVISIAN
jgi:hypothetical protein